MFTLSEKLALIGRAAGKAHYSPSRIFVRPFVTLHTEQSTPLVGMLFFIRNKFSSRINAILEKI